MSIILVLTTAPDFRSAKKIARALLTKKLAACVTITEKAQSFYHWKGKIESADEALLLVKTRASNFSKVEKAIQKIHPYEVPEILSLRAEKVSSKYAAWLNKALG